LSTLFIQLALNWWFCWTRA